jgi:cupin-like protein
MLPLAKVEALTSAEIAPSEIPAAPPATRSIERREVLSREEFSHEYLSGSGKPVVVAGATDAWPARSKWTFDFFASRYGKETILALDNPIKPTIGRRLELAEFLVYCQSASLSVLGKVPTPRPFYASYRPFSRHPELRDDFSHFSFLENSFLQLRGELQSWYNENFGWLFFGPKGTITPLHVDHFMTHAWLAQFVGRKRVLLFSPQDAGRIPGLTPPGALLSDLFSQKEERTAHPSVESSLAAGAQTYEGVINPGEVVFIPSGWAHTVTSLEPSITMSFDVVNEQNFIPHLMMISRKLPQWARKINTPLFRRANQVRWSAQDFALPDASSQQPEQIADDFPSSRQ